MYRIAHLGAIAFTMSLFITDLAFKTGLQLAEAKIEIFLASLMAGYPVYLYLDLKLPGEKKPD